MSDSTRDGDRQRSPRAASNQALYREVNERVRAINAAFDSLPELGTWVCECADTDCMARLELTHEEYEAVRSSGTRFLIAPGDEHVLPEAEGVVERHERYWVVEKVGAAAELVESVNPRAAQPGSGSRGGG